MPVRKQLVVLTNALLLAFLAQPAQAQYRGDFSTIEVGPGGIKCKAGATCDVSGLSVGGASLSSVIARQGERTILTPGAFDVRGINSYGFLLDRWSGPRSGNYESFTVQNSDVTGQDIISPQIPPGHFKGENIRSSMVVPDGTTTGTNSAFGFYVRNDSVADAVGVFGTTVCNKNGASCWAFNPTVIDHTANGVDTSATNKGRILVGSELDVQVTSNDTTVSGYNCTGSSGVQPKAASCFQVGHMLAADPSRGIKWTYGLTIDNATSQTAMLIGANAISGSSIGSMPSFYNYFDNAGTIRAGTLAATGTGAFSFGNTASQNTVEIQPAAAGQFPSIRPGGVDGNPDTGLVLQGKGAGQVIAQSLLNANQGLYVNGKATTIDVQQTPPTSSAAGSLYQNSGTTAASILGPQQPPGWYTVDGVRSVMDVPALPETGRPQTTSSFGFYAINRAREVATGVTGVFGTTACVVDHSACWGFNPTVIDSDKNGVVSNRQGIKLIGMEINPSVTSPDTTVQGVSILGSTIVQPKYSAAFTVGHLSAVSPGTFKWNNAFVVADGTSQTGFLTGAQQASGSNVPGMMNLLNYFDATGTARAVQYYSSANGSFVVSNTAAANGVQLQPTVAGQSPVLSAFGSDTNVSLVLQAQGSGEVVAQSQINAQGGLFVGKPAQFGDIVRLRAYTVATLPACNATTIDAIATVVDASAPTWRGAVSGGGGVRTPVYCDGGGVWTTN